MTDSHRIDLEADFPTDFNDALVGDPAPSAGVESSAVGPATASEASHEAPPVVVIEYRNRGIPPVLMFPIALVVSLAMFAAYHILVIRPKNQELRRAAIRAGEVAAGLPEKPASNPVDGLPTPLTLESQPLPPGFQLPPPTLDPTPAVAAATSANPGPETDEAAAPPRAEGAPEGAAAEAEPAKPPLAVGFSRPLEKPAADAPPQLEPAPQPELEPAPAEVVAEVALAPKPDLVVRAPKPPTDDELALDEPPPPTRDEMIQAIQNEAEAEAIHRDELLRRKQEARARVEAEARRRVEDERSAFRRALFEIVTAGDADAGQRIDQLCNQFGRNYSDEIRDRVTAYLSRVHGRISRDSEIRLLRTLGVPEPGILDFLANGVKISLNSRNGPRNPDEVRVMAAKQLLRSRPVITEVDAARASSAIPRYPGR